MHQKEKKSQVLPGFELGSTAWKSAILTPRPRNQANYAVKIFLCQYHGNLLKNAEILLSFFQFFWLSKGQNSELSRRNLGKSTTILVYFLRYSSRSLTFVDFQEIHTFVHFSQHICHYAEFFRRYHEKKINFPKLYQGIQLFLFWLKICKHAQQGTKRDFILLVDRPFFKLSKVWNWLFEHF